MLAIATLALLAPCQNPSWPPADPDLAPEVLSQPASMPGDPEYAPRPDGDDCVGQLELYGFTPPCTPLIRGPERRLGSGIAADRAWLITIGDPGVTIALADDGVDFADLETVARFALNPGELPFPDVGVPTVRHDINLDGAFTVLDFTSATGTTAPTLDTITDRRLLARDDRGDVNGNGLLDPQDILQVFSDGRDGDDNGYVDDIAGWDFLDDDNDPSAPTGARGPRLARVAVATANNGEAGAGVCPRCSALALRVGAQGLAGGDRVAAATLYASNRRAPVMLLTSAVLGYSPFLEQAVQLAFSRGTLIVASAGTGPSRIENVSWSTDHVLVVGSVGHDRAARQRATSQVAPDPCARFGDAVHVVAPGRCDDAAAARVAGVAGLVLSAARGRAPQRAPLTPGLTAGELWGTLRLAAQDLGEPGWDERTGWGRVDARAAVDAVVRRQIPTHAVFNAPAVAAVLDPSFGEPATIRVGISRSRHAEIRWTIEAAPGREPAQDIFQNVALGTVAAGDDRVVEAALPLDGWRSDPTVAVGTEITVQVRLQDASGDGPPTLIRRTVHVHRDLDTLPAFPVELGANNVGGVRAAALEPGDLDVAIVATTDGQIHAIDGRGRPQAGFPAQAPRLLFLDVGGHPRIPALQDRTVGPDIAAPILAPVSIGPLGANDRALLVTVDVDGRALAFGERGAVQAGFPGEPEYETRRPAQAPAGVTAAAAVFGDATDGWIAVANGRGQVHRRRPNGEALGEPWDLGAPGGSPAVDRDGGLWVATASALHRRTDLGPVAGWPQPLEGGAPATGLFFAAIPAPVLVTVDAAPGAVIGAWGGPPTWFAADGAAAPLVGRCWHTPLAVADIDRDTRPDVLLTVAPANQIAGLAPAEAPLDARVAISLPTGAGLPGFGGTGAGAPAEPLVVDVDGDGRPEAVTGDDRGRLWAIGADGRLARGFPKLTGDAIFGTPSVGDLDGDGRLELVAVTRRGRLWAWRLPVAVDTPVLWDGARGDPRSLGDADRPRTRRDRAVSDGCQGIAGHIDPALAGLAFVLLVLGARRRKI